MKYAQVDMVKVSLTEHDHTLRLTVEDDGIGFEKGSKPIGTGLGLYGMQERAELVGGSFGVLSNVGQGTKVFLQIPIGQEEE